MGLIPLLFAILLIVGFALIFTPRVGRVLFDVAVMIILLLMLFGELP